MLSTYRFCGVAAAAMVVAGSSPSLAQSRIDGTSSNAPNAGPPTSANSAPAPATTGPGPSPTGSPAGSSATLGEVVVTARKTTENIQKAPASIVAVSGAELQKQGIDDPQSLEKVLPSANIRQDGAVVQTFIRGVGSSLDDVYLSPAVAFVYNGIIIPRYGTSGLLFDVGSVQVIAGPQGTLYGGSAAGGAINVNTAQPRNDTSGYGLLDGGNYGEAHVAVDQNMPLGDKTSVRGAINYERHSGYESNGIDAEDKIQGRVSLLTKPTDDITALIFFSGSSDSGKPTSTGSTNPLYNSADPYSLPATGPKGNPISSSYTSQNNEAYVGGANIEWRVGENVFTYIPGFVRVADEYHYFLSGGNQLEVHDFENQHSEELRWSRGFGALKLTGGLFYLFNRTHQEGHLNFPVAGAPGTYVVSPDSDINQEQAAYAGYAQAVYSVTDRLRITAGGRYSYDTINATGLGLTPNPAGRGDAYLPFVYKRAQGHPDWKLGVDYDIAPRILVYANAQTGYIPFGYTGAPATSTATNYVPESRLLAFSGGVKSRFFDNRLELNNEFYYYDYLNFQAVSFSNTTGISTVLPARRATIYGDEISLRMILPFDSEIDGGANIMSAHYNEFSGIAAGVPFDYDGNQMTDAPVANVNAGLQHDVGLGALGDLLGRVQTHYESGHFGQYTNYPGTHQFAYTKTDLTVTYTPMGGGWSVQGYVDNVENQYVYGTLTSNAPTAAGTGNLEPPRTYGIRIFANWR